MRCACLLASVFVFALTGSVLALERQAFQLREDFGAEPLADNNLQYYYYLPCPTYSWFWAYSGMNRGDMLGCWFQIGDLSMGGYEPGDPVNCHVLGNLIRVLDFAGYGTVRQGIFSIEFDIYCSDEYGCPIGPSLYNSGRLESHYGWNYYVLYPPLMVCGCAVDPGPPPSGPRILVTFTHTGTDGRYPAWGLDNISTSLREGCVMHELGCLPALYPRPYSSHYSTIHSGFYGQDFRYCPPQWFKDDRDTTPDGSQYGFLELAWRLYITCSGPSEAQPTTWGDIKSIYR